VRTAEPCVQRLRQSSAGSAAWSWVNGQTRYPGRDRRWSGCAARASARGTSASSVAASRGLPCRSSRSLGGPPVRLGGGPQRRPAPRRAPDPGRTRRVGRDGNPGAPPVRARAAGRGPAAGRPSGPGRRHAAPGHRGGGPAGRAPVPPAAARPASQAPVKPVPRAPAQAGHTRCSRLRLMAVTIEMALYPWPGFGGGCRLRLLQVWCGGLRGPVRRRG